VTMTELSSKGIYCKNYFIQDNRWVEGGTSFDIVRIINNLSQSE